MPFRDGPLQDLKVPLQWAAVGAVILALAGVVAIMVAERQAPAGEERYGAARQISDKAGSAVGGVLAAPGRWVGQGWRGLSGRMRDNRDLRRELEALNAVKAENAHLKDLNERYVALLGLRTDPPLDMISGLSVTDSRGPYNNSRLINVGARSGVKVGYPVMSENGLVGRVIGVSDTVSRVLLLTDAASQTPVMIDRTNARALLTGDGGFNPRLDYLRTRDPPVVGDLVVTSGDGGLFPRGLPVGVVVKGLDGGWRVQLSSDRAPIDFVRILRFDSFAQLSAAQAEQLARVPPPSEMGGAMPQTPARPAIAAPPAARPEAAETPAATPRPAAPPAASAPPASPGSAPSTAAPARRPSP